MKLWFACPIIALAAFTAAAQEPRPGSIEGIVVMMGSNEPVAGATVTLQPSLDRLRENMPPPGRSDDLRRFTRTGPGGEFIFENVIPGRYQLIATRSGGYVPAEYGQRTPTGQGIPFELASGQKMTGIQLAMSATGSISGRVYDRDGEPLGRAQVQALQSVYKDGRRKLTIVQIVESNDRGEYRLFWLPPGRYYVSAKPDIATVPNLQGSNAPPAGAVRITEPSRVYNYEQAANPVIRKRTLKTGEVVEETNVPVFYPGVVDARSATPIAVTPGATAGGVDISVGAGLLPVRHIRGHVLDNTGLPLAAIVSVYSRNREPLFNMLSVRSDSNGVFDLPGVLPGSYLLFVNPAPKSGQGSASIEVGEKDVNNVTVATTALYSISGRFIIEGQAGNSSDPILGRLSVGRLIRDPEMPNMIPTGPNFASPPQPDGSFQLGGVPPGDFRISLRGMPGNAYIKSIKLGNVDVLDQGLHIEGPPDRLLEIVIGANAGTVQGSVVDSRQQTLRNRTVVLVPEPRLRHRTDLYQTAATDSSGQFVMRGVTPGNYKLFAWDDVETGAWQDPDFIRAHENRGTPIQVMEGSNPNMQLMVIP